MKPATEPRPRASVRALVVGPEGTRQLFSASDLATAFAPGDLLVLNDAATMPASLPAHGPLGSRSGARIELRLAANRGGARIWTAALLGAGDWRLPTEHRPPPPEVRAGDRLIVDGNDGLVAIVERVHAISPRLVDVRFDLPFRPDVHDDAIWSALYRSGRPVQYAHVPEALALWDVQNAWAARPWAVEMPSAGRVLDVGTLAALRARGVAIAFVTHAAGLSAVGDAAIDAALPLPERYEVPVETQAAIARAKRVIAVGTSVVRALESAAASGLPRGITDLRLGPGSRRRVVDAILTGVHEEGTSHHALLEAFVAPPLLEEATRTSIDQGFLAHEFGDVWLIWGEPRDSVGATSGRDTIRRRPGPPRVERLRVSAMSLMK
jgi:S-adenosylmethionine:tRNA ribosyltransferase-isomerase